MCAGGGGGGGGRKERQEGRRGCRGVASGIVWFSARIAFSPFGVQVCCLDAQ